MAKQQEPTQPPAKAEANKFDKILKENLARLLPALLRKVIGLKNYRLENLPQIRQQTTDEREPDFLFKIYDEKTPQGRILHGEFETKDDKDTTYRMAEYFGIILRRHRLEVEQHVFYLLKNKPRKIKNELRFENQYLRFFVHHIAEIDHEIFLKSRVPEEVILSVLANPKDKKPGEIIWLILERLVQLKGDSLATRKFVKQLQVLSMLRNLRGETIKQIKNMVISEKIIGQIKKDPFFIQGLEEGIEKGIKKGIKKGCSSAVMYIYDKNKALWRIYHSVSRKMQTAA